MTNLLRKFASLSVCILMLFCGISCVWAAETPVIELSFDGKNYEAGDIATAEVIVYNTSYNVLGFSLNYGDNVTVVDENGEASDVSGALVRMEDVMYRGEGIYSILSCDVTEDNIKTAVYVNPGSTDEDVENNSVSAGSEGRKVATISFKMTKAGVPDVEFATVEGDTEFAETPFFMLEGGTQPAGSTAQIRYKEEAKPDTDQPVDDDKTDEDIKDEEIKDDPEIDPEKDPGKMEEENQEAITDSELPHDDTTASDDEGTSSENTPTAPENNDPPADNDEKKITPAQRIFGIAVIGVAFGVCGGVFLKKIMAGAKKED